MASGHGNSSTSIRALVGHVLTKVQLFGLAFIVVVVFTTLLLILRSSNSTTCRVIESELAATVGPLSRELALGDDRTANALFEQFSNRLAGLGATREVALRRTNQTAGSLVSIAPVCKPGLFSAEIDFPVNFGGKRVATIEGYVKQVSILRILSVLSFIFLVFVLVIRTFALRLEKRLRRSVIDPVLSICGNRILPADELYPDEVREIEQNILKLKTDIKEKERLNFDLQRSKELGDLAAEVAHDILTPLSALTRLVQIADALPEDQKRLLRSASERINDIANSLLDTNRKTKESGREIPVVVSDADFDSKLLSPHLLSYLADPVVSEKRVQLSSNLGIKIQTNLPCSYGLFARVEPVRFKRVISNLLNNAVEAIEDTGEISLEISSTENFICFSISDTGRGIPIEIMPQLMKRGFSFGKTSGSGLGLYQAKVAVEQWGGTLEIHSKVGKGTTVELRVPKANEPSWFVPKIVIPKVGTICILDDDESIHHIWKQRIDEAAAPFGVAPRIVNFASAFEMSLWHSENKNAKDVFYLVDYELKGQEWTGLDVIRKLGISDRSILVTSRFEEVVGIQTFKDLDLQLLPKTFLSAIPLEIGTPEAREIDCILIDNDPLIHMTWGDSARRNGKRLRLLNSPDPFFDIASNLRRDIAIYVDSDLGNGIKGEEVVKQIVGLGFTNVVIETGFSPDQFNKYPWVNIVIGKDPPWDVTDEELEACLLV